MSLRLALDFDNTLVEPGTPLTWRHDAKQGIQALARAGHQLVLFSCRATPLDAVANEQDEANEFYRWGIAPPSAEACWGYFGEMRTFLKAEGVWDLFSEVWQSPGKPDVDLFVDDEAESPEWPRIIAEFGIRSMP